MKKLLSVILSVVTLLTVFTVPVTVSATSEKITSGDYIYVVKDDGTAEIKKYIGKSEKVTVPKTIDGKTVTRISALAFNGNKKITDVKFPDSVTETGRYVFYNCYKLKNVNLGKGITHISDGIFCECNSMKNFVIPSQVVSIGGFEAFPYKLKTITIGKSLKSFRAPTFCNIDSLTKITVSKSNKYFKSKDGVLYNKNMTKIITYPSSKKGKNFTIPAKVKEIGACSFEYQKFLKNVTISKGVKKIGSSAFYDCKELTSINIPSNVTLIESSAFVDCENVEKIKIDANKKLVIEKWAFSGIDAVESITVPKVSGDLVFSECESLAKIKIPSNVKTITYREFWGCPELKTVTIPKTVKKIGKQSLGYISNGYDGSEKIKGFTIKGYKGTSAQKYAKKNGFKFIAL